MGTEAVSYQAEFDAIHEAGLAVRAAESSWLKVACPILESGGPPPAYVTVKAARRVLQAAEWRFYEAFKARNPIEPFDAEFVPTADGAWPAADSPLEFVSLPV